MCLFFQAEKISCSVLSCGVLSGWESPSMTRDTATQEANIAQTCSRGIARRKTNARGTRAPTEEKEQIGLHGYLERKRGQSAVLQGQTGTHGWTKQALAIAGFGFTLAVMASAVP